jgi:hypothetical protein
LIKISVGESGQTEFLPKYAARTCAANLERAEGAYAPPNHPMPTRSAVPWRASLRRAWRGRVRSGRAKAGFAWDEPSQERANEAAKRDCGSDACKVRFGVAPKMCAALAIPDSGPAWGGAVRKSVDEAKFAALKKCQKHAGDKCVIRESKYNK